MTLTADFKRITAQQVREAFDTLGIGQRPVQAYWWWISTAPNAPETVMRLSEANMIDGFTIMWPKCALICIEIPQQLTLL